jgi:hypothetical protein
LLENLYTEQKEPPETLFSFRSVFLFVFLLLLAFFLSLTAASSGVLRVVLLATLLIAEADDEEAEARRTLGMKRGRFLSCAWKDEICFAAGEQVRETEDKQ